MKKRPQMAHLIECSFFLECKYKLGEHILNKDYLVETNYFSTSASMAVGYRMWNPLIRFSRLDF